MKTVSLLTMIAAVGILGATIFLVSNNRSNVNVSLEASTNQTMSGTIVSDNPQGCAKQFYLGCYRLMADNGGQFDLVEDGANVNFATHLGRSVQVVGKLADLKNRNVLMVSSVSFK